MPHGKFVDGPGFGSMSADVDRAVRYMWPSLHGYCLVVRRHVSLFFDRIETTLECMWHLHDGGPLLAVVGFPVTLTRAKRVYKSAIKLTRPENIVLTDQDCMIMGDMLK